MEFAWGFESISRSQGCTDLQSLLQGLDHRESDMQSSKVILGCAIHSSALQCFESSSLRLQQNC